MPRTQNFSCPTYRNFPRTVGRPTDDDRSTATSVRIWATFTIPSLRERTLASSRGSRVGHGRELGYGHAPTGHEMEFLARDFRATIEARREGLQDSGDRVVDVREVEDLLASVQRDVFAEDRLRHELRD